jgi:hypothetical protein
MIYKPILIAVILSFVQVFAQTDTSTISVGYNIVSGFIDESSVYIDKFPNKKESYGVSLGIVYPNSYFDPMPFSPSQNKWPGTVYNGFVCRANYAYYLLPMESIGLYASPQFVFKYVYYKNHNFWDGGDSHVAYSRNENTFVFGIDLNGGVNSAIPLNRKSTQFILLPGIYVGLSGRFRHRNTFTYNIDNVNYDGTPPKSGRELIDQFYLFPTIGIKIGIMIKRYETTSMHSRATVP